MLGVLGLLLAAVTRPMRERAAVKQVLGPFTTARLYREAAESPEGKARLEHVKALRKSNLLRPDDIQFDD